MKSEDEISVNSQYTIALARTQTGINRPQSAIVESEGVSSGSSSKERPPKDSADKVNPTVKSSTSQAESLAKSDPNAGIQGKVPEEKIREKVKEIMPKVMEIMKKNQRSLEFEISEVDKRIVITVIDNESNKVIRQIPGDEFMKLEQKLNGGRDADVAGLVLELDI